MNTANAHSFTAFANIRICLVLCILLTLSFGYAQENPTPQINAPQINPIDTPQVSSPQEVTEEVSKKRHSPKKAAILAAFAPGAGQIYNKKYWKLPIVYVGFAGISYWLGRSIKDLRGYNRAFLLEIDDDPTTLGSYKGITGESALRLKRQSTKRNLDLSAVILGAWYGLQIVDAAVDAHLFEYNINDDISVSWHPQVGTISTFNAFQPTAGLAFTFHFKNGQAWK